MRHLFLSLIIVTAACGKESSDGGVSFASVSSVAGIVGLWKLDGIAFEKLADQVSVSGLHYLQINSDGKFSEQYEAVTRSIGGSTYLDNCTQYGSGVLKIDEDTAIRKDYVAGIVSGGCSSKDTAAIITADDSAVTVEASGDTLRLSIPFTFTDKDGNSVADKEVATFTRRSSSSQDWSGAFDLEGVTVTYVSTCGTEVYRSDADFSGSMSVTFDGNAYTRSEKGFTYSTDACTGDEKGTISAGTPTDTLTPTSYSNACVDTPDDATEVVTEDRTFIVNDKLATVFASTAADTDCANGSAISIATGVFSKR